MDGAVVWSRSDGGLPSRNRYRRIDRGARRFLVRSKAAAPLMSGEIRRFRSLRFGGLAGPGSMSARAMLRQSGNPTSAIPHLSPFTVDLLEDQRRTVTTQ